MPSGGTSGVWVDKGVGVGIPRSNQVIISTSVTIWTRDPDSENEYLEVGYLENLSIRRSRNATRVRHLNFKTAGRVLEQVPSPEDLTATGRGFGLYTSTLAGRLSNHFAVNDTFKASVVFNSLNSQKWYFNVIDCAVHPGDFMPSSNAASKSRAVVTIYGDCWLTNFNTTKDIKNVAVAEDVTFQPSWIRTLYPEDVDPYLFGGDPDHIDLPYDDFISDTQGTLNT